MLRRLLPVVAVLALALGPRTSSARAQQEEAPSGAVAHEEGHAEHEEQPFNWSYGFLGERDGAEPSLLYRPKGMPAPFLSNIVNALILFGLIAAFGRKPIAEGLRKRKERIVAGMAEAAKMRSEAAESLAGYEEKIRHLDSEIERIKREMRDAAETERRRILEEARERRDRMERDARQLIEQELKVAREELVRETVASAIKSAEGILAKHLAEGDQDRMATEYLEMVRKAPLQISGGSS